MDILPEILYMVLHNVSGADLTKCARVCKFDRLLNVAHLNGPGRENSHLLRTL